MLFWSLVRKHHKVSKSLTIQYDTLLYLVEDSELSRRVIGKYINVYHYPDGRKELHLNGEELPCSAYGRLAMEIGIADAWLWYNVRVVPFFSQKPSVINAAITFLLNQGSESIMTRAPSCSN